MPPQVSLVLAKLAWPGCLFSLQLKLNHLERLTTPWHLGGFPWKHQLPLTSPFLACLHTVYIEFYLQFLQAAHRERRMRAHPVRARRLRFTILFDSYAHLLKYVCRPLLGAPRISWGPQGKALQEGICGVCLFPLLLSLLAVGKMQFSLGYRVPWTWKVIALLSWWKVNLRDITVVKELALMQSI